MIIVWSNWNYVKVKQPLYRPIRGPQGYRRLRLPHFEAVGTWRWQGCQPHAPAAFTPQEIFLVLISVRGWVDPRAKSAAGRVVTKKNSSDTIRNRTRDLPSCSGVSEPTAPPRVPLQNSKVISHYCLLGKTSPLFYSFCELMPTWWLMQTAETCSSAG